jgi:ABC-type lipoprotein release transport system permease subunit
MAALGLGRIVASMIYGVSSRDLLTFLTVTMLLILIAFAASLIPALRATRVDPLAVLRDE